MVCYDFHPQTPNPKRMCRKERFLSTLLTASSSSEQHHASCALRPVCSQAMRFAGTRKLWVLLGARQGHGAEGIQFFLKMPGDVY